MRRVLTVALIILALAAGFLAGMAVPRTSAMAIPDSKGLTQWERGQLITQCYQIQFAGVRSQCLNEVKGMPEAALGAASSPRTAIPIRSTSQGHTEAEAEAYPTLPTLPVFQLPVFQPHRFP